MNHSLLIIACLLVALFTLGCIGMALPDGLSPIPGTAEVLPTIQQIPHTHEFRVRLLDNTTSPILFTPVLAYQKMDDTEALYIAQAYTDSTGVALFGKGLLYVNTSYIFVYPVTDNQSYVLPITVFDGMIATVKAGQLLNLSMPGSGPVEYAYAPHTHDFTVRVTDYPAKKPVEGLKLMIFPIEVEVTERAISEQLFIGYAETDEQGFAKFQYDTLKIGEPYQVLILGVDMLYYPELYSFYVEPGVVKEFEVAQMGEFIPLELELIEAGKNFCSWRFKYGNQGKGVIHEPRLKVAPDLFQTMEGDEIVEMSLSHIAGTHIFDVSSIYLELDKPIPFSGYLEQGDNAVYWLEIMFNPETIDEDDGPLRLCMDDLDFDRYLWSWGVDGQRIEIPLPCLNESVNNKLEESNED